MRIVYIMSNNFYIHYKFEIADGTGFDNSRLFTGKFSLYSYNWRIETLV